MLVHFKAPVMAETRPEKLQKAVESSILTQQTLQHEVDQWSAQREQALAEIQDLQIRRKWMQHQLQKYQTYLAKQEEEIKELERTREKAEIIRMSLEPYLDEVVERLADFIDSDLQFLTQERQKRLAFLKDSLNDYRLGLSEKFRRVMEALQVEAGYGSSVEKIEDSLVLDGEETQVVLLRIGRTALFYQSLDGSRVGRFNQETGKWEKLSADCSEELTRAIEMAEKRRAMELVDLPVGRPSQ